MKADPLLKEKLVAESSGIFNLVIPYLNPLIERGRFSSSVDTETMRQKYVSLSDSIMAFVEEHILVDSTGEISKDKVIQRYSDFCDEIDAQVESRSTFFRRFKDLLPTVTEHQEGKGKNRYRVLRGIRFKSPEEELPEEKPHTTSELDKYCR